MAGYVDLSAATATSVPSTAALTAGTVFNFWSPGGTGGTQDPTASNNNPNTATSSLGGPASSVTGGLLSPSSSSMTTWLLVGAAIFLVWKFHK